jgi:hypothetical protein
MIKATRLSVAMLPAVMYCLFPRKVSEGDCAVVDHL